MSSLRRTLLTGLSLLIAACAVFGQNPKYRGAWPDINGRGGPWVETEGPLGMGGRGTPVNEDTVRTAREIASHSSESINWTNAPGFEKDVFTFTRGVYSYGYARRNPRISGSASPWGWITDFPDSDLNLSYRLQEMTSLKVDPDGRVIKLTDPNLFNYPWLYMVEPGRMELKEAEVPLLRNYLRNGGVLMVDDFWGAKQWGNFEYEIKRALPEAQYQFTDLPMDHPIFHCVFDLKGPLNKLQTPNAGIAKYSLDPRTPYFGQTWEDYHDDFTESGARDMHVRAILDSKGRIMVIATHNCDNGDGWEREGENDGVFHEFAEKRAFPLGINIVFYLMTH